MSDIANETTKGRFLRDDPNYLFTLRVPVSTWVPRASNGEPGYVQSLVTIWAFDGGFQAPNHNRIDVVVKLGRKVVFPRGATYCGLTQNHALDGVHAKELVLSLVAMKPGDTDREYFASYTDEQIAFVEAYGEMIDMARMDRYCDTETGEVKRGAS